MHIISTLDGKTILCAVAVILGIIILFKGMGTKPGGSNGKGGSGKNGSTPPPPPPA